jgi:hypothetical protein
MVIQGMGVEVLVCHFLMLINHVDLLSSTKPPLSREEFDLRYDEIR